MSDCRVNGKSATGYWVNALQFVVPDGGGTSHFFIHDNSLEGWTGRGVTFTQGGPSNTGTLGNIEINDNEIKPLPGTDLVTLS